MKPADTTAGPGGARRRMRQRIAKIIARWRLERRRRRDLESLDANALRDLGLDRSEYGSYLAECVGIAEPTRRRVVDVF